MMQDPMSSPNTSPTSQLTPGLEGHACTIVTANLMAPVVGSGTVAVYATPSLVALMEKAAVNCVEEKLGPGHATLGVHLDVSHTAATPEGLEVFATATLTSVEGRKLVFSIVARDSREQIGKATHTRVVVDTARFNAKLAAKAP
jgi:fluoroacetyl-CoA thioesterase